MTLDKIFLQTAKADPAKVHFWKTKKQIQTFSYSQLCQGAQKVAGFLQVKGLKPGQRVAIVLPTHPEFYFAFWGILLAGGVPSALYPPVRLGRIEEWKERTFKMLQALSAQAVLTNAALYPLMGSPVSQAKPSLGCHKLSAILAENLSLKNTPSLKSDSIAVIQFSSGSTSHPKPVALTHDNILNNARAFLEELPGKSSEHSAVSWLPLYHDMGLIGIMMSGMLAPGDITLIPPERFVGRPLTWLEAISQQRATVSVAPNFAFGFCVDKIRDEDLGHLDLSRWQVALCGAEPIQKETLIKFASKFQKVGFNSKALTPVYGLAEASLAVSFSPIKQEAHWQGFNVEELEKNHRAIPDAKGTLLPSHGRAVQGVQIQIRNEQNQNIPSGHAGRIWVKGNNVMAGYLGLKGQTEASIIDGWLNTGDRGFIFEDNLYLCGRFKDLIIIRGRNYDPAGIEASLDEVAGVRRGCSVAFSTPDAKSGTERLVLLVETRKENKFKNSQRLTQVLREVVLSKHGLEAYKIVLLKPGTLPRTSSGKIRRSEASRQWRVRSLKTPKKVGLSTYIKESLRGYWKFSWAK